ncbi:MAG: GTPase Era [Verrucomicrobiota bacterium]
MNSFSLDPDNLDASVRCGMVAIVGKTNVGKSTLLNRILEEKVSIVSNVVQTTRNVIRAILTEERGQLVFLDTPGIHKPMNDLGRTMNKSARQSIEGIDISLLMLDASNEPEEEDEGCMRRLLFADSEVIAVLNKQDLNPKHGEAYKACWARLEEEKQTKKDITWFDLSARTGQGVDDLLAFMFEHVPLGPQLFPEDVLTDFPKKLILSDTIREKFFHQLHDEVPHQLAVGIDRLRETDKEWRIEATVYVNRPSQKGIVIGKNGRLLKKVSHEAEKELSAMYDRPVRLDKLWVKVEKNWMANHFKLKQLGYKE